MWLKGAVVYLGTFKTEREAAIAYDQGSLMLKGKDVRLNFPLSDYLDAQGRVIEDPGIRERVKKW